MASKVWFCRNCGYEVGSRGRCHQCRAKLIASPLPALEGLADDDEVGYRLDDWEDRTRGRLIEALIGASVAHRFEGDELVVAADDEERTDEIVARVTASAPDDAAPEEAPELGDVDAEAAVALGMLLSASRRLRVDPTDMEADGEVAEASAGVFAVDRWPTADEPTWAAVGRVTRRLLAALGSEEALEDDIKREAGVLATLLAPIVEEGDPASPAPAPAPAEAGAVVVADDPVAADPSAAEPVAAGHSAAGPSVAGPSSAAEPGAPVEPDRATAEDEATARAAAAALGIPFEEPVPVVLDEAPVAAAQPEPVAAPVTEAPDEAPPSLLGGGPETSYEVPDWLPDQRALLTVLLEDAGIRFAWDGPDLVVPSDAEEQVEALFDRVGGVAEEDDDETRYHAIEELFASVTRLATDPDDPDKARDVLANASAVEGPTPLGFDDGQWLALRRRTRTLADALDHKAHPDVVANQAASLRDALKALV